MSETPPRTLMQELGQVICTAGHRLTPTKWPASTSYFFAAWESLSLSSKQKPKCTFVCLIPFCFHDMCDMNVVGYS